MGYLDQPDILLTWDEVREGGQEGVRRFIRARELDRPTGDGRFDAQLSTIEWDVVGAWAERAFAKHRGVPWNPLDRPDRYREKRDVDGWDVKGSSYDPAHLIVPLSCKPKDRFVLLCGWLQHWRIAGWFTGKQCHATGTTRVQCGKGGNYAYWIPDNELNDWPPRLPAPFLDVSGLQP